MIKEGPTNNVEAFSDVISSFQAKERRILSRKRCRSRYSFKIDGYRSRFWKTCRCIFSPVDHNVSGNSNRLIIDDISDDIQQEITQNGENLDPMWWLPLV